MGGMDMAMVTPVRRIAAWIATATGLGLTLLVLLRPAWPIVQARPDPQSAHAVGMLLMEKYMVAFEGAGFMILLGIFGAVFMARVERHPDKGERGEPVARGDAPPAIEADLIVPGDAGDTDCASSEAGRQHAHGGHA